MPIWIIGSKRSIVIMFYYISEKRTTDFVSVNKYIFIVCPDYILQWFNILTSYTDEAINYHKKLTKWPKKYKKTVAIIMKSFLLVFIILLTCVSSKSRFIIDGFNSENNQIPSFVINNKTFSSDQFKLLKTWNIPNKNKCIWKWRATEGWLNRTKLFP